MSPLDSLEDTLFRRRDGLRAEPHGERFLIQRPDADSRVSVSRMTALTLLYFDGETPVSHIEIAMSDALDEATTLSLEGIVARLEADGLIERVAPEDIPLMALPDTDHLCEGCGRSCEGHLIGPLTANDIARIRMHEATLREADPTLPEELFFTDLDDSDEVDTYITLRNGACIFLGEDRLCQIHALVGPEMKPALCRSFPVLRVRTEDGFRLGINNACVRHYRHVRASFGPPEPTTPDLAELEDTAVDARVVEPQPLSPLFPSEDALGLLRLEAELVAYMGLEDATLDGLLARIAPGESMAEPCGRELGTAWLGICSIIMRGVLGSNMPTQEARTGFGRDLQALEAALRPLLQKRPTKGNTFSREAERFLLGELRRLLWLREYVDFGTPERGIIALVAGWSLLSRLDIELGWGFAIYYRVLKGEDVVRWHRELRSLRRTVRSAPAPRR